MAKRNLAPKAAFPLIVRMKIVDGVSCKWSIEHFKAAFDRVQRVNQNRGCSDAQMMQTSLFELLQIEYHFLDKSYYIFLLELFLVNFLRYL